MSRRRSLRGEQGVSLVVAVAAMAIMSLLGTVAVQQAVTALQRSTRDEATKATLQAADAAVDSAIYQLNRLDLGGVLNVDPADPAGLTADTCVASAGGAFDLTAMPQGTEPDPQGRRWCPPVSEDAGGVRWQYRVSQLVRVAAGGCEGDGTISLGRDIVAVGAGARGVVRRIHARLRAPVALLSGAAVQSGSSSAPMTLSGTARVLGDAHANHDILGSGGAPAVLGDALPGPGDPPHRVAGVAVAGSVAARCHRIGLPLVDQRDARTVNQNGSWTADCVGAGLLPVPCKPPLLPATGGTTWNPATRELRVWGNGRLRLTGQTYSLCRIRLEGQAILQVPASVPVARIFLDDPGECRTAGGDPLPGAGQIVADGQSRIVNCHTQAQPETLQLYGLGSPDGSTTQTLAGGAPLDVSVLCGLSLPVAGTPMTVYAPRSRVQIEGSTAISGQVVGDTVHLGGAAAVQPVTALINLNALGANPVLPLYQPDEYVECRAVPFDQLPANQPAQGC